MVRGIIARLSDSSLKASYTVEGSFIFGMSIIIITMTLMWGFDLYRSGSSYIQSTNGAEINAPKRFRQIQAGKEILHK